jgi:hypothetical protein
MKPGLRLVQPVQQAVEARLDLVGRDKLQIVTRREGGGGDLAVRS